MERRQLPDRAQGDILWIGPEKGLITTWTRATPVNGVPLCWIMLWYTKDGGLTWTKKWAGQGRSLQLEIGIDSAFNYEDRTSLVQDHQGNIYVHRSNKMIRAYKNGPESWDQFDGFTIPSWPAGLVRAPLVFVRGVNNIFILAEINGRWIEFTTKNLTKWDTFVRIDQRQSVVRWIRAGFTQNGSIPRWFYVGRDGSNWKIQLTGVIDQMGKYPSETVHVKAGTAERIGAVASVYDRTGKTHLIWTESDSKNIFYKKRVGATWTDPIVIGEYTGHSINNWTDASADPITAGFQTETPYAPYMNIHSDGIGLVVTFAEVNNAPGAVGATRYFNLKKISFDGTNWGAVETIELDRPQNNANVFKYIGAYNNSTNYGINALVVRDGSKSDDLYFYPLTNEYQPYAPKSLAPANGLASEDLNRPLSWVFSDPVPGDAQTAYQIEIYRQSDSELMWDSGKVTSSSTTVNIPNGANLVHGVAYQWRVRTWDTSDLTGAWSDLALFKTSAKPVATIVAPTEDEVLSVGQPDIVWTYSDPESLPQIGAQVQIIDPENDEPIFDSEMLSTSEVEYRIPPMVLLNGGSYIARVRVQDQDGIISDPVDQPFSVEYVAPATPTVLPNVDEFGGAVLNIISENPANDAWVEDYYKVYRKELGKPDFELIAPSVLIPQVIVDNFETTQGWGASGAQATDPVIVVAKEGVNALGFGTSGAGNTSNTKSVSVDNANLYDQAQLWLQVNDNTKFDYLRIKLGTNLANYYYYEIQAEEFTSTDWQSFKFSIDAMQINGSPRRNQITMIGIEIWGATQALTPGFIKADKLRVLQSNINFYDRNTTIGRQYLYGVSAHSVESGLDSSLFQTAPIESKFTAKYINFQLVPQDLEDITVEGFMDGSKPPQWSHSTETQYHYPKGSSKPIAVINAAQAYIEGSVEIRFFDQRFGGRGLEAAELLQYIKNSKPILLRTWWGRNYYVSIDGEIDIKRQPGIGWFASFNFTEINP